MIKLKDYQKLHSIDSGQTETELTIQLCELIGLNTQNLTKEEVKSKIQEYISSIIVSRKKHPYIRLNGKRYKVDTELTKLKFAQFILLDQYMKDVNEKNVSDKTHKLISIFIRPTRFYFFPKKFNTNDVEKISNDVLDLEISIALNLINVFFYVIVNGLKSGVIESLNNFEKMNKMEMNALKN